MFWAKIRKKIYFLLKINVFTAVKYCCILHGRIFVMKTVSELSFIEFPFKGQPDTFLNDTIKRTKGFLELVALLKKFELSCVMRKPTFWFPTWSDTNQAAQLPKMTRGLKFRIKEVEGLYYPCCENKGAVQLRSYREADLRLCFCICKTLVFTWSGSIY